MDKQKLEEMNLRMQIIKNGLEAIKTIGQFTDNDECRKFNAFDMYNKHSKEFKKAKENIIKELLKLEEFKIEAQIEQREHYQRYW